MINIYYIILLLLIINFIYCKEIQETVSITPMEYCEGCKITVELYIKLASKELTIMQEQGKIDGSPFEATDVINDICEDKYMNQYSSKVKYACIKVINEFETKFLESFVGTFSAATMKSSNYIYERKKEICVDKTNSCHPNYFNLSNLNKKKKKCGACRVVANDIETLMKLTSQLTTFEDIVDNSCYKLSLNHSPYIWMENYCEDILENHRETIVDVSNSYVY
jgi:hypothetical protein